MKYQLHFTIQAFPDTMLENYDYWVPLMEYFIKKSDTIEIHCWNEEKEVIKETKALFQDDPELPKDMELTIFRGILTEDISHHLLNNHIVEMENIKWFSIFLSKGYKFQSVRVAKQLFSFSSRGSVFRRDELIPRNGETNYNGLNLKLKNKE